MKIGFSLPNIGPIGTAEAITKVAQRAEALGYSTLWTIERLWWRDPSPGRRVGRWGEIMPQEEFFGVMSLCDGFRLLLL